MALPVRLQSWYFGVSFAQSLKHVALAGQLAILAFLGSSFNPRLAHVTLPTNQQTDPDPLIHTQHGHSYTGSACTHVNIDMLLN